MKVITAECPDCGVLHVSFDALTVRVCTDTMRWSYAFNCPRCSQIVARQMSERVANLLVEAGAIPVPWTLPSELTEPKVGPVISLDDVLDFHLLLEGVSTIEDLVRP